MQGFEITPFSLHHPLQSVVLNLILQYKTQFYYTKKHRFINLNAKEHKTLLKFIKYDEVKEDKKCRNLIVIPIPNVNGDGNSTFFRIGFGHFFCNQIEVDDFQSFEIQKNRIFHSNDEARLVDSFLRCHLNKILIESFLTKKVKMLKSKTV